MNPSSSRKTKKRSVHSASASLKNKKGNREITLREIVAKLLSMLNTIKLYHWNTTDYSTHKATDKLYDELSDKIDTFVEILLGKENVSSKNKILSIDCIKMKKFNSNTDFKKETETYKTFLFNLSNNKMFNTFQNTDLMNMRDEILGALNQFLYLLYLH